MENLAEPPTTEPAADRPAGKKRFPWRDVFLLLLFGLVVLAIAIPYLLRTRIPYQALKSPVAALRTINTAAVTYASAYENGYPLSLSVMAPPPKDVPGSCRAAGLIDATLASGQNHGYVFIYTPGPPVKNPPPGCTPGALTYTVAARPLQYGRTGRLSFYTDESGVIRRTADDRPATTQDPPIE